MKISVNLANVPGPRERYALAWAVPVSLFGAGLLAILVYSSVRGFVEYGKLGANLNSLQNQEQELRRRETSLRHELDQPQSRQVLQKANFVNDLIGQRQLTATELTEKVSKLMPSSVRLISMSVTHPKEGVLVRFGAVGHTEADLETFLGNVDDSPDFKDLNVAKQGFQETAQKFGAPVGITCAARYVGNGAN